MKSDLSNLAVNFHFINACNMKCVFCFADKGCDNKKNSYRKVINKCSAFKRINFVGGEPTLEQQLPQMVDYANSLGMETSIVTNGFTAIKQNNSLMSLFSQMTTVGFSVDSVNHQTNLSIGRSYQNETISFDEAVGFCSKLKEIGVELKINTVVNQYNKNEDFNQFIDIVKPSRWKIFQVMPAVQDRTDVQFCITKNEFEDFIERHNKHAEIMRVESNESIQNSYIMINSDGYFVNTAPYIVRNDQKSLYSSDSILAQEFEKMKYDINKYESRYEKDLILNKIA